MSIEVNIVCDGCSAILVAASSVGKARREGKRDKSVVTFNGKDFCPDCYKRYKRDIEIAMSAHARPK